MKFWEKLDLLMKISNTTNSALSVQVNLDASHISRLRRGKRNALKDEACLRLMSEYFARRCVDDYQRKALADVLNADVLSVGGNALSEFIMSWLIDEKKEERDTVENFLKGLSNFSPKPKASEEVCFPAAAFPTTEAEIYYGLEGKRQAVEYFLAEVLAQKKPQTLLLYSDEPTDWMTADREFALKWAALMIQVLAKGNRIKIIHTVSRDLDEMLHAIIQWMPLYMSGAIEPYYYPKKRDGVFKKTLFIAPNTAAITSNSIGNMIGKAANFLIRNHSAVEAVTEEFNQYLELCHPLMHIFTPKYKTRYFDTLLEFEKEKGNCIIITESLSLLTIPQPVILSVASRIVNSDFTHISELAKERIENFKQLLQNNSFYEIIRIYDGETIKNGEVSIASSSMMSGGAAYYTLDEYICHLENIQTLLKNNENYHVYLTKEPVESRYMVYAKEDLGAIVSKTSVPSVALAINESNLTAAFWDHLRALIGERTYRDPNNTESCDKLSEYIHGLKQCLKEDMGYEE